MKGRIMKPIRIGLLVTALVASAALQACDRKVPPVSTKSEPTADSVDPRSKAIGQMPQPPKSEGTATTSTAPSTVSKQEESKSMPLPGQANDHSTLTKDASQKSKEVPKK
jgi:hypothetical protein